MVFTLQLQTYAHIFEEGRQDWQTVAGIIDNLLDAITKDMPHITGVRLRSDNAGCYKNTALLAKLALLDHPSGKYFNLKHRAPLSHEILILYTS